MLTFFSGEDQSSATNVGTVYADSEHDDDDTESRQNLNRISPFYRWPMTITQRLRRLRRRSNGCRKSTLLPAFHFSTVLDRENDPFEISLYYRPSGTLRIDPYSIGIVVCIDMIVRLLPSPRRRRLDLVPAMRLTVRFTSQVSSKRSGIWRSTYMRSPCIRVMVGGMQMHRSIVTLSNVLSHHLIKVISLLYCPRGS